ncbi:enoyl-CoA hydratase/isomerase family protein [Lihuaxuella thermophila]|nr:enoyl-CoA hydratase/isomerase family protein [Lihuaxuella thermophila]
MKASAREQMGKDRCFSGKKPCFEHYPHFQVQYHELYAGGWVAAIVLRNFSLSFFQDEFLHAFERVMIRIAGKDEVRAVILTGEEKEGWPEGQDFFVAVEDLPDKINRIRQLFHLIEHFNKPVLAAVARGAFGHGCELLGAVHLVIADQDAIFGACMPSAGGTQRLPRLCQSKRGRQGFLGAVRMLVQGRVLQADEAWRTGLVDEISPGADVFQYAVAIAKEYIVSGEGLLWRAYVRRKAWMMDWELKKALSDELVPDLPHFSEEQKKVWELIRYGYQHGFQAGLIREEELYMSLISERDERRNVQMDRLWVAENHGEEEIPVEKEAEWLEKGQLLPPGVPFYPRFTQLPEWQYAFQVVPIEGMRGFDVRKRIVPVKKPKAYEVLLYVLASEVNHIDLSRHHRKEDAPFTVTGHMGLGLVVAIGEEVKREGWLNIGEMVTIHLQKKPRLPVRDIKHSSIQEQMKGVHQQFAVCHITQVTPNNHLWNGYWDQRDLFIHLVPFSRLQELAPIRMSDDEDNDICVIQHALPRLDLMDSKQLFEEWTALPR